MQVVQRSWFLVATYPHVLATRLPTMWPHGHIGETSTWQWQLCGGSLHIWEEAHPLGLTPWPACWGHTYMCVCACKVESTLPPSVMRLPRCALGETHLVWVGGVEGSSSHSPSLRSRQTHLQTKTKSTFTFQDFNLEGWGFLQYIKSVDRWKHYVKQYWYAMDWAVIYWNKGR